VNDQSAHSIPDTVTPAAHPVVPLPRTASSTAGATVSGAACPTCRAVEGEPCHVLEFYRRRIVHRRDRPSPTHAARFHATGLPCAAGCPACPAPSSGAKPEDGWSVPDDDGISVRLDGADRQFVILWNHGHITVGTVGDLCALLSQALDADTPPRVVGSFLRHGDRLTRVLLRYTDHGDLRTVDVLRPRRRGPACLAQGSYPGPRQTA
jgi:hypothetical protein